MPLRLLRPNESLENLWDETIYTEGRLGYHESTKPYAGQFTLLADRAEGLWIGQHKVWRNEATSQAAVDGLDTRIDARVMQFARTLLNTPAINNDQEHPRFRRYFAGAPSRFVRLSLEAQVREMQGWPLSLASEPEAEVQAFAPLFTLDLTESARILGERQEATTARKDHRAREIASFVQDANQARQETYGKLLSLGASLRLPEEWAAGFFRRTRSRRAQSSEEQLRGALYTVLGVLWLEASEEETQRIETGDDAALRLWLARAPGARSVAELFVG
jgi:hypothetical protein